MKGFISMWYFGKLAYAEIKLLSQIKLDTIHSNGFVTGLLLVILTYGKWYFTSSFDTHLSGIHRICYILNLSTRHHLKCTLILLLRLMESVDDFLCFATTEGNLIFIHEYSKLLVKHTAKKKKKLIVCISGPVFSTSMGLNF